MHCAKKLRSCVGVYLLDGMDKLLPHVELFNGGPCQTLSNGFLKFMKTWKNSHWCWMYFSRRMRMLKICSVVLLAIGNVLGLSSQSVQDETL